MRWQTKWRRRGATREAEQASLMAQTQSQIADEQKRIAIEQRAIAIDSINTLLEEVQQKLDFNAGALRLREQLIKTATKRTSKDCRLGDASSLKRSTMFAYSPTGKRAAIARQDRRSKEDNGGSGFVCGIRLSWKRKRRGLHCKSRLAKGLRAELTHVSFGFDAKQIYTEAVDLLKLALAIRPEDNTYRRYWISFRAKIGDIDFSDERYQEAKAWFEPALADIAELAKSEPTKTVLIRDHCIMLRRLSQVLSALQEPGSRGTAEPSSSASRNRPCEGAR